MGIYNKNFSRHNSTIDKLVSDNILWTNCEQNAVFDLRPVQIFQSPSPSRAKNIQRNTHVSAQNQLLINLGLFDVKLWKGILAHGGVVLIIYIICIETLVKLPQLPQLPVGKNFFGTKHIQNLCKTQHCWVSRYETFLLQLKPWWICTQEPVSRNFFESQQRWNIFGAVETMVKLHPRASQ